MRDNPTRLAGVWALRKCLRAPVLCGRVSSRVCRVSYVAITLVNVITLDSFFSVYGLFTLVWRTRGPPPRHTHSGTRAGSGFPAGPRARRPPISAQAQRASLQRPGRADPGGEVSGVRSGESARSRARRACFSLSSLTTQLQSHIVRHFSLTQHLVVRFLYVFLFSQQSVSRFGVSVSLSLHVPYLLYTVCAQSTTSATGLVE